MNSIDNSVYFCRFATSPVLRDPVVRKNNIEVRGRHSYFAALRHDVREIFKGASLYKVPHPSDNFKEGMSHGDTVRDVNIRGELLHKREKEIMQIKINKSILELVQGDITEQTTDAIVNAANHTLLGGGGVDGAIHQAAGPDLLAESRTLGGCSTGDAKITKGYRLKARHVIHTVGPIYRRAGAQAPELLASAYCRSLEIASENHLTSIAFPSISTGAYGYPLAEAAPIALRTVADYLKNHPEIELVRFVLFDDKTLAAYEEALNKLSVD